jgi:hypothetical protein
MGIFTKILEMTPGQWLFALILFGVLYMGTQAFRVPRCPDCRAKKVRPMVRDNRYRCVCLQCGHKWR